MLVGLHLGVLGLCYFKVPTLPRDSQWTGTGVAAACGSARGGAGSGELLKSGQGADDLGTFNHQSPGGFREDSAAAQPTTGVSGDVCVLRMVLDFKS